VGHGVVAVEPEVSEVGSKLMQKATPIFFVDLLHSLSN
jgi:hypothetical protein